jgi:hypothetical protein
MRDLRERIRSVWAEWTPSYGGGRLYVANLVITTRKQQSMIVHKYYMLGAKDAHESSESSPAGTLAPVRHLSVVAE